MTTLTALAPAKVNLFLHVGPVDAEGYHPLASLVAFADVGDRLTARVAAGLSLTVGGPFSTGLDGEGDNLVLRAVRALKAGPGLALKLDKTLPIAAGLGGGSSDAGAALRLAARLIDGVGEADLRAAALTVGADGPMCLNPMSAWAEGRGERLTPEPRLPPLHAILVNPRVPSSTGAVYRAYDAGPVVRADRPEPPTDWSPRAVIDWLGRQRNDLERPALELQPAIGPAMQAVARSSGVGLTRMSGSGATVFGLFVDPAAADDAASRLSADHGDWWVVRTVLGGDLTAEL
ncbi:MAG: 4-(cytidine 5'-diphospho)-2-C-methyl-D-erythritol kinase [Brevundimonas sp.]|uniref:4-(cytidine 5'-diphospho)-2-C-methyl-D-erythritol kinase n=1 Tax=Brevundimonas sp. TaxID=1871086 RepID=UPI004034C099